MSKTFFRLQALLLALTVACALSLAPASAHEQEADGKKENDFEKKTTNVNNETTKAHDGIEKDTATTREFTGDPKPAQQNNLPMLPTFDPNAPAPAAALPDGVPAQAAAPLATATGPASSGMDLSSLTSMATKAMTGMATMQALPSLGSGLLQSVTGLIGSSSSGGNGDSSGSGGQSINLPPQLETMPVPDTTSYAAARGSATNILYAPISPNALEPKTIAAMTALRQGALENAAIDAYSVAVISKNDAGNTPALAAKLEGCASASPNIRTDWQCNTAGLVTQNQQTMNIVQTLNHLLELRALNTVAADPRISSLTVTP